jgi:hypothetical protein
LTTQIKSVPVALRSICRDGNTTFTADKSMKAILDAIMVAKSSPPWPDIRPEFGPDEPSQGSFKGEFPAYGPKGGPVMSNNCNISMWGSGPSYRCWAHLWGDGDRRRMPRASMVECLESPAGGARSSHQVVC